MPRRKLAINNWVAKKKDGTEERFSTYMEGWNAKRDRPDEFEKTEDIRYVP